jgi:hypothetical protein
MEVANAVICRSAGQSMTFAQLIARYESGAIASHEFAVESLIRLDPRDPSAVLDKLPPDVMPRLREFIDQYRPGRMIASQGSSMPDPDQLEAAWTWLDRASTEKPRLTAM